MRRYDRPSRRREVLRLLCATPLLLPMSIPRTAQASDKLLERPIARGGETLPVIGIGTWQTFDVGNDAAARERLREVLSIFAAAGGRAIDSSPMYGTSEAVVGDLAAELRLRARLFYATKVWTSGRAEGIRQMELSMRRLRSERIDLMQVHNLVDVATHARTLADWKEKGRVRYVGITHYAASAYGEVERAMKSGAWDFLQINYSLEERESARRLLPLARELGMSVIVNRPFAEGGMFRRTRGKPLPPWAAELGIASWAQFFLKWILGHPAVTCAIPGTGKPEHMRDNLAAGLAPLPDEAQRERMTAAYDAL